MRLDRCMDLRKIAEIILADLERVTGPGRISAHLPEQPVLSDIDPDAFGIICRNLVENALRYGSPAEPIDVTLEENGTFRVSNDCPAIQSDVLAHLTERFQRDGGGKEGTGLGLAIVAAIADRISSPLILQSPRPEACRASRHPFVCRSLHKPNSDFDQREMSTVHINSPSLAYWVWRIGQQGQHHLPIRLARFKTNTERPKPNRKSRFEVCSSRKDCSSQSTAASPAIVQWLGHIVAQGQ